MTISQFLDDFNTAPYDDLELADIAKDVDDSDLSSAASALIEARNRFNAALDRIGYEKG